MKDYIPITEDDSTATGLLGEWWRCPPYAIRKAVYAPYRGEGLRPVEVEAEVLVPVGKRIKSYDPAGETGLLNAVLDVAQGTLSPLRFADRFGLLGYNSVVPNENHCKGGDPLEWFLAQVHTIYVATDLMDRLREAGESAGGRRFLADLLNKELPNGPYALGGRVVTTILRPTTRTMLRPTTSDPIPRAKGILHWLLNANLGRTGRRLQVAERGFRTIFTFRGLVEFVYWQLADQLGKSSIHRCRECSRIFTHSNPRARFCPPVGGRKISPCKSRWNVRRFRRKKRSTRSKQ